MIDKDKLIEYLYKMKDEYHSLGVSGIYVKLDREIAAIFKTRIECYTNEIINEINKGKFDIKDK